MCYATGCLIVIWFFQTTLSGRNIDNFNDVSLATCSQGLPICVSTATFQKSSMGWPQQPLTERVSDINEKLDF